MNKSPSRNDSVQVHAMIATFVAILVYLLATVGGGRTVSAATADTPVDAPATDAASAEQPVVPALNLPFADNEVRATSLFHVARSEPNVLDESRNQDTDRQWEIFSRTQLAYLRSYFLIQSALRSPGVANLNLLQGKSDKESWLIEHLECGFLNNSEILYISLQGPKEHAEDLRMLVNAVGDAYLTEVVYETEQRRLVVRDALQRSLSQLVEDIQSKSEVQMAIARDLGIAKVDGGVSIKQQIELRRLEQIDAELMRLEGEQLAKKLRAEAVENQAGKPEEVDSVQLKFLDQRIEQLRETQAELEERIAQRENSSVEFAVGAAELATLQSIANEMNVQLEKMEIESVAPDRIRQIQKATITPASSN